MKILLTSLIGALIISVIGSISTTAIIDIHRKAEKTHQLETERIELINEFIVEELMKE